VQDGAVFIRQFDAQFVDLKHSSCLSHTQLGLSKNQRRRTFVTNQRADTAMPTAMIVSHSQVSIVWARTAPMIADAAIPARNTPKADCFRVIRHCLQARCRSASESRP